MPVIGAADSATGPPPRYRSFRELIVWQQSMDLVVMIHRLANGLPKFEMFGLAQELRKTARSIPANIAEGFNRRSRAAYRSHVAIALGSQAEIETQLELAHRLGYLSERDVAPLLDLVASIGRLLHGLWRALA